MNYTFKNTEINNEKASVFETKSLLYLIGKSPDKKHIEYITFDCFNDVSGIDKGFKNIWDIQSKNEANLSPKKIGKYLFTLFDNYLSSFNFKEFIFFCPKLKDDYKIDKGLLSYNLSNIVKSTFNRIKKGLEEEAKRVKGTTTDYSSKIDSFLSQVLFVEDNYTEYEYLKFITKFKNKNLKTDDFYLTVFKELRDIQSSKKNSYIENESIKEIMDVINFRRHLKILDIDTLLICRIIGCEIFQYSSIPLYFFELIKKLDVEDIKDILLNCNSNLSRCFFNKVSNKEFWKICESIINYLESNSITDTDSIFSSIFTTYVPKYKYLDEITIKYLIALITEGLE
ncbi:hypothetical protein [Chryseobacterium cucumeris]|uniref:hypothetical protein n=1 Tax=Chryseobacterium cucumeris TaxID=1813611 RepID=UPI002456CFB3|nr:hypothetical protein [Chryseobacterium cucumeris]MDH5033981.1 hypothetical protein [Chryseobacterium cucumeris]